MTIETILGTAKDHLPWQQELYKQFHQMPEPSLKETKTSAKIAATLAELGVETSRVGTTGLVAVLSNGDGPVVLFRADIDGLAVTEQSGLEYASTNGHMHACGHDFHFTSLIGATRALHENRDAWSGTFIGLFQPAEETAEGARDMVEGGLATAVPRPDVVLGQHVMPAPAGRVGMREGVMMSQADSVKVTLHGRGAHGSMPHASVDPVVLAASIIMRLQTIVGRTVSPSEFSVVTVGAVHSGTAANIIPASAELLLNLRHFDGVVRERVIAALERIIRAECEASGAPQEPDIEYYSQFPLTENDAALTARVRSALEARLGADRVITEPLSTGSEDFSIIASAWDGVPYTFWFVGGFSPEVYEKAQREGTMGIDVPMNHSPFYAPLLDPTLEAMTETAIIAAGEFLAH